MGKGEVPDLGQHFNPCKIPPTFKPIITYLEYGPRVSSVQISINVVGIGIFVHKRWTEMKALFMELLFYKDGKIFETRPKKSTNAKI